MQHLATPFVVKHWLGNPEDVQLLDPLYFDAALPILHALNREKNIPEIIQLLYRHLPVPDRLDHFTYDESLAAMRDLGFFIGILKRHGIEPVDVVPELEYVLLVLMVKTGLPPRDTLIHYTVWNPPGIRLRTYTGLEDEKHLIESVRVAYYPLLEAISLLERAQDLSLHDPNFISHCNATRTLLENMVKGVVLAKRNVSPSVFANELRYYYESIKVDYDRQYLGPGAVEMPMFVIDHLLWSCDCDDQAYTSFKEGYLPYNLFVIRQIYERFNNSPSLITRMNNLLEENSSAEILPIATALAELCTVLKSFRMPHKKLAENAYAHQDDHHHTKGSGGYSVDILQHIMNLQNQKTSRLMTYVQAMHQAVHIR